MTNAQLSKLVNRHEPHAILDEIKEILLLIDKDFDLESIDVAYQSTINLFAGNYPGYQACNTEYHDLSHAIDTCLTMARLIHGATLCGESFNNRNIYLSLTSALLHDSGFIQEEDDLQGTGAQYTASHVQRSIDFMNVFAQNPKHTFTADELEASRAMLLCTDLAYTMDEVVYPSSEVELLSKLLGAADLMAQMADPNYLQKLLFLYNEFREAKIGNYASEIDLLRKTVGFYDLVALRLDPLNEMLDRYSRAHFSARWNIEENMYQRAIEKRRQYLLEIVNEPDPRVYLI
ncbi:MAG TPA: hypothetical protein VLL52_05735 [Anaerolineae bacterium]|nr:hypothetical protein [Anaerolineae bacterium]